MLFRSQYSLEGQMLNLNLQYFDHLMRRADLLEKTLIFITVWNLDDRGQKRSSETREGAPTVIQNKGDGGLEEDSSSRVAKSEWREEMV